MFCVLVVDKEHYQCEKGEEFRRSSQEIAGLQIIIFCST